jgi:hypothetical protein
MPHAKKPPVSGGFFTCCYNPEFDGCPLISQLGAVIRKDFLHYLIFTVMVSLLRGNIRSTGCIFPASIRLIEPNK